MLRRFLWVFFALFLLVLAGCGVPNPEDRKPPSEDEIAKLALSIQALGPNVDPAEAARAARITYFHTQQLAREYQITDPPLIHNSKVNRGIKPRGLCWHWADDIESRLQQENFRTLSLHRAIANHDKPFLIEHSTTIVSARGDGMFDGIVLDPWRYGGVLFWEKTREDKRYDWTPRAEVFEWKRKRGTLITRVVPAG